MSVSLCDTGYSVYMDLTPDKRFSRHLALEQIGEAGQRKLAEAHILIIGLGGLGSPAALYLAAAGVGQLTFADFDTVEISNLQRQIAHNTARVGELKTSSARIACQDINPQCRINTLDHAMDEDDLASLVPECTVVLDCSDNFATRFAVNDACVHHAVPLVSGAAIRFDAQISVEVVGMVGCVQAIEAIKLVCGIGESLAGRLVLFDGLSMEWHEIQLKRNPECTVCQG